MKTLFIFILLISSNVYSNDSVKEADLQECFDEVTYQYNSDEIGVQVSHELLNECRLEHGFKEIKEMYNDKELKDIEPNDDVWT